MGVLTIAPAQAIPFQMQISVFDTVSNSSVEIANVDETVMSCDDVIPGQSAVCDAQDLQYGSSYTAIEVDFGCGGAVDPGTCDDFEIDNDPNVTGSMTVTNTFNTTQHFTLLFTLPVSAISAPTQTSGSYRATFRDGGEVNGATLATQDPLHPMDPGTGAFYQALIDNAVYGPQLYVHPQSFSSAGSATGNVPVATFGSPVPFVGPAVSTSIGIRLDFTLTPFDRATFTSNHFVIPEPHTGALMALGLAVLAARRRRY
jgi:hypothetical protein